MDKKNKIISLPLFLLVFIIYLFTLSPAVNFEDSGEFITSIHTMSIAHPPGYPLYLLLGKLFSFLPIKSIEFRVNLMSAFFAALSAVILYMLLVRIFSVLKEKLNIIPAFIVLFYFLSSTLWGISLVAEVYTLNLFLTSLLLLLIEIIFIEKNSKTKYHYLFFYLLGIGVGNHHTIIFIGLLYGVFFIKNKTYLTLGKQNYIKFLLLFLLGASLYIYLPIRAMAHPTINWGNPSDMKKFLAVLPLGTFLKHILTVNPVYELFKGMDTKFNINYIPGVIIMGLILYFIYFGIKKLKNKNLRLFFILLFCLYSFFIVFLANAPEDKLFTLKVFFIPAWFSFYFILFYGILKTLKKYSLYFFPLFALFLFLVNLKFQKRNNYYYTRDYALNILNNLSYQSILFTLKDNETFPIWDMKYVRYKRPDIYAINLVLLSEQWYLDYLNLYYPDLKIGLNKMQGQFNKKHIRQRFLHSIIMANQDKGVYFTSKDNTMEYNKFIEVPLDLKSSGLLYKLNYIPLASDVRYDFDNLIDDYFKFLNHFNKNTIEKFKSKISGLDTQTRYVLQTVAFSFLEYANGLFQYGLPDDAKRFYQYSIYINDIIGAGINNIYAYANIGNIFLQKDDKAHAVYFFKKGVNLQPQTDLAKKMVMKINRLTQAGLTALPEDKTVVKHTKKEEQITATAALAENFYAKKDYNNAIKYYKKLLKMDPKNPRHYSNIGDCYFNIGQYKEAVQFYKQAIKYKKDYTTAYYNLGGCYLMLKQNTKAKKTWETGLQYAPGDRRLLQALKQYFP